jgi:hypothetical protein
VIFSLAKIGNDFIQPAGFAKMIGVVSGYHPVTDIVFFVIQALFVIAAGPGY